MIGSTWEDLFKGAIETVFENEGTHILVLVMQIKVKIAQCLAAKPPFIAFLPFIQILAVLVPANGAVHVTSYQ